MTKWITFEYYAENGTKKEITVNTTDVLWVEPDYQTGVINTNMVNICIKDKGTLLAEIDYLLLKQIL